MAAMLLLDNSNKDDYQRVLILVTCADGTAASKLKDEYCSEDYTKLVSYDELASDMRQCECDKKSEPSISNRWNSNSAPSGGKKFNSINNNNNFIIIVIMVVKETAQIRITNTCQLKILPCQACVKLWQI